MPAPAVDLLAAVIAPAAGADDRVGLHRLRVDDCRTRLRLTPGSLPDPAPQPVVELGDQSGLAPAPEEGIDPVPAGEVHRHRPPLDAVVDHVEQAMATLASWRLLRKLRCSTTRITPLVQAVLTLHLASSDR